MRRVAKADNIALFTVCAAAFTAANFTRDVSSEEPGYSNCRVSN
jgi:hypothetical protein